LANVDFVFKNAAAFRPGNFFPILDKIIPDSKVGIMYKIQMYNNSMNNKTTLHINTLNNKKTTILVDRNPRPGLKLAQHGAGLNLLMGSQHSS
jgi:hypothetical protein